MESPQPKHSSPPSTSTALSSPPSTPLSHPLLLSSTPLIQNSHNIQQNYLSFKRKLLFALTYTDPLGLLQSGIFQQYEHSLFLSHNLASPASFSPCHVGQQNPHFSSHQLKMNTYPVGGALNVTQLERRSRSCQRISAEQNAARLLVEQQNIEFIMFNNAIRSVARTECQIRAKLEEQYLPPNQQKSQIHREAKKIEENRMLQKQNKKIKKLQREKQDLQLKAREYQFRLEQLAKIQTQKSVLQTINDSKDNKLEFLLKEKQLLKKLQQYRQQNEHLRGMLQTRATEIIVTPPVQSPPQEEQSKLLDLRQKVAAQGRVRWALSRAWAAQLETNCK